MKKLTSIELLEDPRKDAPPARISVIGSGYVGLATALGFASNGFRATAFEIDSVKRERINRGDVPFVEPGLHELLKSSLEKGFQVEESLKLGEITFLTVGTPGKNDGSIDLTYIKEASRMIGRALATQDTYVVIVVKSTVVPGTTENVILPLLEAESGKKVGRDFGLVMNPEFLREGSAVRDMMTPERVVIGEYDSRSGDAVESLYDRFYKRSSFKIPPIIRTSVVNAEFIKYASNAFLATKISFINSIANIAQRVPGADVEVIARGMGLDVRIGNKFLNAGLGYGGSCFPKDIRALLSLSQSLGYCASLLGEVERVNERQFETLIDIARDVLGGFKGKVVTVLGLSFKPGTDDLRDAVSLRMIKALAGEGAFLKAYDPSTADDALKSFLPKEVQQRIALAKSTFESLQDSVCCFVVTEWDEFKHLQPEDFIRHMKNPLLLDGRRIYDPARFILKLKDFYAVGLGRKE